MFAYRKAVTAIKSLDIDITDADQLEGLPGVGDGIIRKIREFIADGTIKKFEFIDTDERTLTIQLLEGVWGLGPKGAEKLYNKGIKSIVFSGLVNNIFDRTYESNGYFYTYNDDFSNPPAISTIEGVGFYPQAGINFLVGINLKF